MSSFTPVTTLRGAILKNRMAHAYLFYGPDISSQMEAAVWTAKALNCQEFVKKSDPCGECHTCIRIERRSHPDVAISVPQGALRSIKIAQIRQLQLEAALKPYEGKAKVQIIQEADCLHPTAANAFLKTLEEPPQQTFFILLTTRPDSILATIKSRCQGLQFLAESNLFSLDQFPECEADPVLLEALREFSGGSLRQARSLVKERAWDRYKSFLKLFVTSLKGTWIGAFQGVEKMVELVDDEMELLEQKAKDDIKELDDASLREKLEDEQKAYLAGERMNCMTEGLRLILAYGRVSSADDVSYKKIPSWVRGVEEARRFLERGAKFKWVLESFLMKIR